MIVQRRLQVTNVFGQRAVPEESVNSKDVYIISIAGEGKTEEQYFEGIKELVTNKMIWIDTLKKADKTDTMSHPKHVIQLLDERRVYWEECGAESDELWMVVDRDPQDVSEKQIESIIDECENKTYGLALSNPTFEFWLLLHLTSIQDYDYDDLLKNAKQPKGRKRYIDQILSKLLTGYNKSNLKFDKFKSGIEDAISRSKELPTDNLSLITKLGTSVGTLVEKMMMD